MPCADDRGGDGDAVAGALHRAVGETAVCSLSHEVCRLTPRRLASSLLVTLPLALAKGTPTECVTVQSPALGALAASARANPASGSMMPTETARFTALAPSLKPTTLLTASLASVPATTRRALCCAT